MSTPSVTIPLVHRNGTSAEALYEEVRQAGHAVCAAITALTAAAPNARDYYVQGTFRHAAEEHRNRLERLTSVRDELAAILEGIVDQEPSR